MNRILKVAVPTFHKMVLRKAAKLLQRGDEYDEFFFASFGPSCARVSLGRDFELVRKSAPATITLCTIQEKGVTNHGE